MQPDSRKLLQDMLQAGQAIQRFAGGKALADLKSDELLRSGIYFQFLVVGEALSQLTKSDPATAAKISEHARIIAFRNQIIHGYARIDDEITWRILERKVPILIQEVENLLVE